MPLVEYLLLLLLPLCLFHHDELLPLNGGKVIQKAFRQHIRHQKCYFQANQPSLWKLSGVDL
jgi:hypothetical protein